MTLCLGLVALAWLTHAAPISAAPSVEFLRLGTDDESVSVVTVSGDGSILAGSISRRVGGAPAERMVFVLEGGVFSVIEPYPHGRFAGIDAIGKTIIYSRRDPMAPGTADVDYEWFARINGEDVHLRPPAPWVRFRPARTRVHASLSREGRFLIGELSNQFGFFTHTAVADLRNGTYEVFEPTYPPFGIQIPPGFVDVVSGNGQVFGGHSALFSGIQPEALLFTRDEASFPLMTTPFSFSFFTDANEDGSVMVGYQGRQGEEIFVLRDGEVTWLEGGAPAPVLVSADGRVVVGWNDAPFYWTEESGVVFLDTLLEAEFGLDLGGRSLDAATGLSDDGRVVVGRVADDSAEIYRIDLPPFPASAAADAVPEPAFGIALAVGALCSASIRARSDRRTARSSR